MADNAIREPKHGRKPKARKFYRIGPNFSWGPPGYVIENETALLQGRTILSPPVGHRGFPGYPEPPRVLLDKRLGRAPSDLEQCSHYWLISDRMKTVVQAMDPDGFAFSNTTRWISACVNAAECSE